MPIRQVPSYRFRSNSDLCLTGYHRQILPGVFAYGIQFDLYLYVPSRRRSRDSFIYG